MNGHGCVPIKALFTKASQIWLVGTSQSASKLASIPKLQIEKLLFRVLRQLVLGHLAPKWQAWDLNVGPSVPELMFFPPCLVVIDMVPFKSKFIVQRRNSAQLNTQLLP